MLTTIFSVFPGYDEDAFHLFGISVSNEVPMKEDISSKIRSIIAPFYQILYDYLTPELLKNLHQDSQMACIDVILEIDERKQALNRIFMKSPYEGFIKAMPKLKKHYLILQDFLTSNLDSLIEKPVSEWIGDLEASETDEQECEYCELLDEAVISFEKYSKTAKSASYNIYRTLDEEKEFIGEFNYVLNKIRTVVTLILTEDVCEYHLQSIMKMIGEQVTDLLETEVQIQVYTNANYLGEYYKEVKVI